MHTHKSMFACVSVCMRLHMCVACAGSGAYSCPNGNSCSGAADCESSMCLCFSVFCLRLLCLVSFVAFVLCFVAGWIAVVGCHCFIRVCVVAVCTGSMCVACSASTGCTASDQYCDIGTGICACMFVLLDCVSCACV